MYEVQLIAGLILELAGQMPNESDLSPSISIIYRSYGYDIYFRVLNILKVDRVGMKVQIADDYFFKKKYSSFEYSSSKNKDKDFKEVFDTYELLLNHLCNAELQLKRKKWVILLR